MKKYRYIFHFVSGQSQVMKTSTPIDLAALTSQRWFFINDGDTPSFCNNGGEALNVNNIEFIEVFIIDEK